LKTKVTIFLIVIFAAILRIYNIEQKNLWFDEVFSWKISQGSIKEIVSETSGDIHPPLFYIALKLWTVLFTDGVFSMRMLSVLLSLLSIYFIYKLSHLCLKNDVQIIAVLLLFALSPLNIYYSQEVRMLNMNLFLCLGSVYYFLKLSKHYDLKYGLLYVIFSTLAIYTHYFAFLVLITEAAMITVYYAFQKAGIESVRKFFLCFTIVNLFYVPWFPVFFNQILKGQPWRTEQSILQIFSNVFNYFHEIFLSTYTSLGSAGLYYLSIFVGLFLVSFMFFSILKIVRTKKYFPDVRNSVAMFFFIPLFIASLISLNQSIVLSRYLSIILPYLFITIVYFSFNFYKRGTALLIVLVFLLISCYGTFIYFSNTSKNNDYRNIISYIENNYHEGDEIVAEPHFMGWVFKYYLNHNKSNIKLPVVLGWNMHMQIDSLKKINEMDRIWFILDYSSLKKNNYDSLSGLMRDIGFKRSAGRSFNILPSKVSVDYFIKNRQPEH